MTSATNNFGAYAMQVIEENIFMMVGNSPGNEDGCQIFRSADGVTLVHEFAPYEQGANVDCQVVGGDLWVCGQDPNDDWSFGNLYRRTGNGDWAKIRTQPNVIHTLGMWHDGARIWVGTGSHIGDNVTWRGRVLRSADDGQTWELQVDVNNYRIYDVIGHAGRLYAIGHDWTGVSYTQDLHFSSDNGATWSKVSGVTPRLKPRERIFGTSLLIAGYGGIYSIDSSHVVTFHATPFDAADHWNIIECGEFGIYVLDGSGYVWHSSDIVEWSPYVYVPGAISISWWSGVGLMIANSGQSAQVLKL